MMDFITYGVAEVLNFSNLVLVFGGTLLGFFVGAFPGLS